MKIIKTKIAVFVFLFVILNSSYVINYCFCQWEPDVRLTNNNAYSELPSIAVSGSVVHVVWEDYRDSNWEIYYKRSTDGGTNWEADTRLTSNSGNSWYSSVAVSGPVVHVVWHDARDGNDEIYYKRSTDGGTNWGVDTRLTNNTALSYSASVAVSGSVVHVVWYDYRDGNWEIYCKRSADGGTNWGADTRLTNNTGYSRYPSIAVSGSVVHIIWEDYRDSNWEIYCKRSTDEGTNWGMDTRLTNNNEGSYSPSVAVSGSVVHVVWYDYRDGNREIYFKRSTDEGTNWGADARLTNNTAASWSPSIVVSGLVVHVLWYDYRDGNPEIYHKRSTDGGINWGADIRLTNNTANSYTPSIAVSGSFVHVVWTDNRDGNYEKYYKRNPTGNLAAIRNISAEIPLSYSLGQNYPNPFNPSTNVQFSIPEVQFVTLKVFDMLGKEIQTLINESLQPGIYEATFDGTQLTSGVFFYRLKAGDFAGVRKMLLVK